VLLLLGVSLVIGCLVVSDSFCIFFCFFGYFPPLFPHFVKLSLSHPTSFFTFALPILFLIPLWGE